MIYIVRHGQTVWNLQKRKQGRMDSPLTLTGIEQGKQVGNFLPSEIKNLNQYKLIVSPLYRTWQYAEIIRQTILKNNPDCIIELEFSDLLKEHSFGEWEGKTEDEIEAKYPGEIKTRENDRWNYVIKGGESYQLLQERVKKFTDTISNDDNIILVTHEMVSKVMRGTKSDLDNESTLALGHPQNIIYNYDNNNLLTELDIFK